MTHANPANATGVMRRAAPFIVYFVICSAAVPVAAQNRPARARITEHAAGREPIVGRRNCKRLPPHLVEAQDSRGLSMRRDDLRAGGTTRSDLRFRNPVTGRVRNVRLVIFDMDGTLIDSRPELIANTREAAEAIGLTVTDQQLDAVVDGSGIDVLLQRLHPTATPAEAHTFRSRWLDASARNLHLNVLLSGVRETLQAIRDRAPTVRMAIATNRGPNDAHRIAQLLGIEHYFDIIAGSGVDARSLIRHMPSKPQPNLLYHVARRHGTDPSHTVMVGDTAHDVHASQRAGMGSIGVRTGMGGAALDAAHADHYGNRMTDILAMFGIAS